MLKTLGADSRVVIQTYLFQTLVLGLVGSLAGVALGMSLQYAMPSILASLLPGDFLRIVLAARRDLPRADHQGARAGPYHHPAFYALAIAENSRHSASAYF